VYQYTLSTPWDLSTASYDSVSFSTSSEGNDPWDLFFKDDGTKMFVVSDDDVFEYDLSTPWVVSSAAYNGNNIYIKKESSDMRGIAFKADGFRMFLMSNTAPTTIFQYSLAQRTPWELNTAAYNNYFHSIAEDTTPNDVAFKSDGTKMYIIGDTTNTIYQYTLSTPWRVSSAVYDAVSFSVAGEDATPEGLVFKPDGTKMYIIGASGNDVHQYTLSTPWDLATASYDSVFFDVGSEDGSPRGVSFKTDGTKMYMIGNANNGVYQYTLSTAWDVGTASYDTVSLIVTSQDDTPTDVDFKTDGAKMFIVGDQNDDVYQYTLSTPWDLSSAVYDNVLYDLPTLNGSPTGIAFNPDGSSMYCTGDLLNDVFQYSLATV